MGDVWRDQAAAARGALVAERDRRAMSGEETAVVDAILEAHDELATRNEEAQRLMGEGRLDELRGALSGADAAWMVLEGMLFAEPALSRIYVAAQESVTTINPGIRRIVELLNEAGFRTTDSGDGETHDHACDRDHGYVVIQAEPKALVEASDAIAAVLEGWGITVGEPAMHPPPPGTCWVQATYCPADGIAVIDVSYIHDRMLPEEVRRG